MGTLAIRIRRRYVAVQVLSSSAQCIVDARDGGQYFYGGIGDESIRRAASDPWAVRYRTLTALRADHPDVDRESGREYDR